MATTNVDADINRWLPLAEYSIKHQVSISTLRRRIKADDIKFRFDDGKYLILEELPKNDELSKKMTNAEEHRPSQSSETQKNSAEAFLTAGFPESIQGNLLGAGKNESESIISIANRLLADLKKAYVQILQEKEEQILQLREETQDLKTLIKVLESENSRLRD